MAAAGGNLDDAAAAPGAQVRQRGTVEMDRTDQVGGHEVLDLRGGEFPVRAEQAAFKRRIVRR
jgi:hypothetical protein